MIGRKSLLTHVCRMLIHVFLMKLPPYYYDYNETLFSYHEDLLGIRHFSHGECPMFQHCTNEGLNSPKFPSSSPVCPLPVPDCFFSPTMDLHDGQDDVSFECPKLCEDTPRYILQSCSSMKDSTQMGLGSTMTNPYSPRLRGHLSVMDKDRHQCVRDISIGRQHFITGALRAHAHKNLVS